MLKIMKYDVDLEGDEEGASSRACQANDVGRYYLVSDIDPFLKRLEEAELFCLPAEQYTGVWEVADNAIENTYPNIWDKPERGWWGEQRIPNFGILRGSIASAIIKDRKIAHSKLVEEQKPKKWISVNDKLPAHGQRVLCYEDHTSVGRPYKGYDLYYYDETVGFTYSQGDKSPYGNITHWIGLNIEAEPS
jgi:hypothetical protein